MRGLHGAYALSTVAKLHSIGSSHVFMKDGPACMVQAIRILTVNRYVADHLSVLRLQLRETNDVRSQRARVRSRTERTMFFLGGGNRAAPNCVQRDPRHRVLECQVNCNVGFGKFSAGTGCVPMDKGSRRLRKW